MKRDSYCDTLSRAGKRALGGGIPGFLAMLLQVVTLMWMRTLVNYQYSRGGTFADAFATLYAEGGIARFYSGFSFAVIAGPLSRFGDTAANAGIMALCDGVVPVAFSTVFASGGAALWRIFMQPLQNIKTLMQVAGGGEGMKIMASRVSTQGVGALWEGALGSMGATWMGHYPWYVTYNLLNGHISDKYTGARRLIRNALIGFCSSFVSDCVSNSLRVVTTAKQTSAVSVGYLEVTQAILAADGLWGLVGRGLFTKICSNGLSAMLFSVMWRYFQDKMQGKTTTKKTETDTKKTQ